MRFIDISLPDAQRLARVGLPRGVQLVLFKTTNSDLWREGVGDSLAREEQ